MKDSVYGALMGVLLGDALGMPVETMTRSQIKAKLGPMGVTGFIDPMQTRVEDTKNMRAGDTTDDWQLTKVVLTSLVASHGWDPAHAIKAHYDAFRVNTFGWGKGSVAALQAIVSGTRDGFAPPPKTPGMGLGNGVMMKVAPLALYHALRWRKVNPNASFDWKTFGRHVRELGYITHSDPRAWIAAFAVGMVMVYGSVGLLKTDRDRIARGFEIARCVQMFEAFCVDNPNDRVLGGLMREAVPALYNTTSEAPVEKFGSKFIVLETLPFTIATFMRHPFDFRSGVLEAVNAGGDTDTNAAIVGAMIGANVGLNGIPKEWREFRPEFEEAITLGDLLSSSV